jgi:PAS domain S-box-containing protein
MKERTPAQLRASAEQLSHKRNARSATVPSEADALRLLHELQVHQIELELQNDELKETRAVLEAALSRYTNLYDLAPVGYLVVSPAGLILQGNLSGSRLLGMERSLLVGNRLESFISPSGRAPYRKLYQKLQGGEPQPVCEVILQVKGEDSNIVRLEAVAQDRGLSYLIAMTDVSDLKLAEANMLLFAQAVQQSPIAVVISNLRGQIEYVNRRFTELSGYEATEAIGRELGFQQSDQGQLEDATKAWTTVFAGHAWSGDFESYKKDGTTMVERASVSPMRDDDGLITHILWMADDVTAQRELENKRRRSQKI